MSLIKKCQLQREDSISRLECDLLGIRTDRGLPLIPSVSACKTGRQSLQDLSGSLAGLVVSTTEFTTFDWISCRPSCRISTLNLVLNQWSPRRKRLTWILPLNQITNGSQATLNLPLIQPEDMTWHRPHIRGCAIVAQIVAASIFQEHRWNFFFETTSLENDRQHMNMKLAAQCSRGCRPAFGPSAGAPPPVVMAGAVASPAGKQMLLVRRQPPRRPGRRHLPCFPSHRILRCMHKALNIDKNNN
jgi:hypothetical protein